MIGALALIRTAGPWCLEASGPPVQAWPGCSRRRAGSAFPPLRTTAVGTSNVRADPDRRDRKSTRLNSSHGYISYAVFCLKKKKKKITRRQHKTNNKDSAEPDYHPR